MTLVREFNLYLTAGRTIPLVINVNQFDSGEEWHFTLFKEDGTQYIPSTGAIVGIKSDGLGIINSGTVVDGKVVINETQQMTAAVGKATFELTIDSGTHGTANFVVLVEEKPGNNADLSDSDISLIQEALNAVSPLPTGGTVGQVLTKTAQGSAWSDAGTPTQAQVAEAVSDWADENITVETGVVIDTSLSVAGAAADAKKTGDEISDLKSAIQQNSDDISAEETRAEAEEARLEALFTAPTQEAVDNWLDAHPEATTTVQDASLTEAKFTDELKLKTVKEYVTPEMYGAKGDGATDDTDALQNAIDSGYRVIASKNYVIKRKLTNTNGICLTLFKDATIRLDSSEVIDCMFELTHGYSGTEYNGVIDGTGVIDGNYKCKTLIGLNLFSSFSISGVFLQNFTEKGINSRYNDESHSIQAGGGLTVNKVRIKNTGTIPSGTYGVYDNGNDNIYEDIIVQDCQYGFYCNNSIFNKCHHWISDSALFDGSVSFLVNGKTAIITDVIVDTVQTAVEMANTSGASANVKGLEMYNNTSVISVETANQFGFTVFKPNTFARLIVSDVILMLSSSYTNVKFVSDSFFTNGNYITRFKYDNVIFDSEPINYGDRGIAGIIIGSLTSLNDLSVGTHTAYCNNNSETGMVEGWAIIVVYPISNTAASIAEQANAIIFNLTNNTMYHAFKRNGAWGKIA